MNEYKAHLRDLYFKINDKNIKNELDKYISKNKEDNTVIYKENIKNVVDSFNEIVNILRIKDLEIFEDIHIYNDNIFDINIDCYELKRGYINILLKDLINKSIIIRVLDNYGGIGYYNGYREVSGICIDTYRIDVDNFTPESLDKYKYEDLNIIHRVLLTIVHVIISSSEKYLYKRESMLKEFRNKESE